MAWKITRKYCTLGGCCGLAITRQLLKDLAKFIVANATLGGCVTVIGNGLDLGNVLSSGSLYNVMDSHSAMTLTFNGSDGTLSRSKTGHQALLPQ